MSVESQTKRPGWRKPSNAATKVASPDGSLGNGSLSIALPDELENTIRECLAQISHRNLSVAVAESCTGGLLASFLTDIEGMSHVFDRGFVVYTDDAKREMLNVPGSLLQDCGAVSKPIAIAMAEGVLEKSHADIALAITGFAGAAGEGAEEGLVHCASAFRGGTTLHREAHFGPEGRDSIRLSCIRSAVDLLHKHMLE
ncbi:CinA family protein [Parasphingopyxis marina]|uniref:CinA family protein n=1 Tax=Parasphingopyxis marina TaxID=2761622 RepID=A0A842HWG3_9SPHN|nr:CinA family protein [Parasphingopyxis marina]MBC2776619.1 CinA family protein [Parasphingopyxis marina]